ncbi:MAG: hypothetical protein ACOYNL_03145 [Rickettsiales bacterium]
MKRDVNFHYRWDAGSAVTQLDVRAQKNGQSVAYLYAAPDAPQDQLLALRAALRLKGWGTLSDNRGGKFALRVSGIRDPEQLIGMLGELGYTHGTASISEAAPEKEQPRGFMDSLRAHSLRASGIFYTLGNVVYLTSGILRSKEKGKTDYGQIQSALTWGAGDILVAAIGGKDDGRQMSSLLTKLKLHYISEGIDLPVTAAIHVETANSNKTLGQKISNFAHDYLNQIKCLTEFVAAFGYFKAGKDQGNFPKQITAVTFGTGFLASALIPEKKIDGEKYAQAGPLGKLWMKIQSNPLSVGGLSGYSNTILTSYSALEEGRRYNNPSHPPKINKVTGEVIVPSKYYKLDYLAPGVMFFGNGLYAASKKTAGGDIRTTDMISDAYRIASQVINKLPEDQREAALESTARFLGERPEVRDTREEARERLVKEMAIQRQNPWFENTALPGRNKAATASVPGVSEQPATQVSATDAANVGKGVTQAHALNLADTSHSR